MPTIDISGAWLFVDTGPTGAMARYNFSHDVASGTLSGQQVGVGKISLGSVKGDTAEWQISNYRITGRLEDGNKMQDIKVSTLQGELVYTYEGRREGGGSAGAPPPKAAAGRGPPPKGSPIGTVAAAPPPPPPVAQPPKQPPAPATALAAALMAGGGAGGEGEGPMRTSSEAEQKRREWAEKFKEQLTLEVEAERRQQPQEWESFDGISAASIQVTIAVGQLGPAFNSATRVSFVDAVNSALGELNSRYAKKERTVSKALLDANRRMNAFLGCLIALTLGRVYKNAAKVYQELIVLFAGLVSEGFSGKVGMCSVFHDWLAVDPTKKSNRGYLINRQLDSMFHDGLQLLRRLVGFVPGSPQHAAWLQSLLRDTEQAVLPEEFAPPGSPSEGERPSLEGYETTRWPKLQKLLKTTPVTMTRLLMDLRERFQQPDFQARYQALFKKAMPGSETLIDCALSVQKLVLPKYGFKGTPEGVNNMRQEVGNHIGHDGVVHKVMKDIHFLLEVGKPLPLLAGIDAACAEAARCLAEADVFLLSTGAGFSADSGLAVYADVARLPAYAARGLEYSDLCQPAWLRSDPQLFWGFWGQCHNDYRGTTPHEGYEMILRWVDNRFRNSEVSEAIQRRLTKGSPASASGRQSAAASVGDADDAAAATRAAAGMAIPALEPAEAPYPVAEHAGAFFAFTSNVDAHHYDWFRASEIRECHGNTELYQCAFGREGGNGPCGAIWRAPLDFEFNVDNGTMLAPEDLRGLGRSGAGPAEADHAGAAPRVGRVRGGGRPNMLRNMPGAPRTAREVGFYKNHPVCPHCNGPARPAILMFGDLSWRDVTQQRQRWEGWTTAVKGLARERQEKRLGRALRVAILEVGAGGRVATVRHKSEQLLHEFREAGSDVRLVRVNPEMPLADDEAFAPDGPLGNHVVSIMARGLEIVRRIDASLPAGMRSGS